MIHGEGFVRFENRPFTMDIHMSENEDVPVGQREKERSRG